MKLLHKTGSRTIYHKQKIETPPYIKKMAKNDLPFFLTRYLEEHYRDEFVILAQTKQETKGYYPWLLLICHRSFEASLRKKLDMDLMLDIEAKKIGRVG